MAMNVAVAMKKTVIIVNYERGVAYVTHPQVKGILRRVVGADTDYTYAYIDAGQGD